MLQRATLRRPAQPGTARSPGTGTWPTRGPAARAPDRRSLTPRIAHRHGAAANEPTWPGVTIGVPGAATASRHGNPERRSTPGSPPVVGKELRLSRLGAFDAALAATRAHAEAAAARKVGDHGRAARHETLAALPGLRDHYQQPEQT